MRSLPNILITGTPGTGKTTLSQLLLDNLNSKLSVDNNGNNRSDNDNNNIFNHLNVGDLVKDYHLHDGYNHDLSCFEVNDDKVLDHLENVIDKGGNILDWHSSEIFPQSWLDLVIVLRCDHQILWNRLEQRNYKLEKIQENNDAEIFGECANEAIEAFDSDQVIELNSNDLNNLDDNIYRFEIWFENWLKDHKDDE